MTTVKKPRKPQDRALRSARKLLDAASELLIERGVESTTVDEIVARAGVSKGTFYHHFDSKSTVLAALRENVIDDFEAAVLAAVDACSAEAPDVKLQAWIDAAFVGYLRMEPLHDIVFGQRDAPPRWSATGRAFMERLVEVIDEGNKKGMWNTPRPHLAATYIFMGLLGVVDDLTLRGEVPCTAPAELSRIVRNTLASDPMPTVSSAR